jgi:uncharacterized protein (TIGR03083 family)
MSLEAITLLNDCMDSVDSLLADLNNDQWAVQSYCPDWDVRGVAMHLAAVEHMLSGDAPGSWTESVPFSKVGDYIGDVDSLNNADLLAAYRQTIAARRQEMAGYTAEQLALPSMTPVGAQTYGRFMAIRVFDYWVHEQDIRGPLGIPGHESGAAAEMALNEIEISLPYIVGKKIGVPEGKGMTINLTGPVEREMHVKVDGRAGNVDSLPNPDVVLNLNSTTFALLACGRIDPQGPIDDGRVTWSGDPELGEKAARSLRFTM